MGCQWGRVAANEIGPLVPIHADPVAQTVGKELVVGAVSGVADYLTGRRVYCSTLYARPGRVQGCALRPMHDVENLLHVFGRLTHYQHPRDVRLVALDG